MPADDVLLKFLSEMLDDLEGTRIACGNRLSWLTRATTDADGEMRGFGLSPEDPRVQHVTALVSALEVAEKSAVKRVETQMKLHPLHDFVANTPGIGLKQGARLLSVIGDPYHHYAEDRPRTVSELWAYCGLHIIPVTIDSLTGQSGSQTQSISAGEGQVLDQTSAAHTHGDVVTTPRSKKLDHTLHAHTHRPLVSHTPTETQSRGADDHSVPAETHATSVIHVAPKRTRGQKSNWSEDARKRVWLISVSCMKNRDSPYRSLYEAERVKYASSLHKVPCARCGPAGKPAAVGSPLSAAHQHARALRRMSKEILKDLWLASQDWHAKQEANAV